MFSLLNVCALHHLVATSFVLHPKLMMLLVISFFSENLFESTGLRGCLCVFSSRFVARHSLRGVVLDRSSNLGDSRREPPFSRPKQNCFPLYCLNSLIVTWSWYSLVISSPEFSLVPWPSRLLFVCVSRSRSFSFLVRSCTRSNLQLKW